MVSASLETVTHSTNVNDMKKTLLVLLTLLIFPQITHTQELFDYEYCPGEEFGPSIPFLEWCQGKTQESEVKIEIKVVNNYVIISKENFIKIIELSAISKIVIQKD